MTPRRTLGILLAALLVGLIVWLPARVLAPLLPGEVRCLEWRGTVWQGRCLALQQQNVQTGEIRWDLRALSSVTWRPELELQWTRADSTISAIVTAAGLSEIRVRTLRIDLAFATLRESLPVTLLSQWSLPRSGRLQGDNLSVELIRTPAGVWQPSVILGSARVLELPAPGSAVPLGDFEARFVPPSTAEAPVAARLRDLGGPISLQGDLRWQPADGRYQLSARVRARSAIAVPWLEQLGPPAADGRRDLVLEGSI